MHPLVVFGLLVVTLIRILGIGISIDFYLRTKDSRFKIYSFGWFLWGCAGILPLIAINVNNQIVNDFLLLYNILLSVLGILLLGWSFSSYFFIMLWRYIIIFSIIILLVPQLLFSIIGFKLVLPIISLFPQIIWILIILLPLIKWKMFIKQVDKLVRYNFYGVIILGSSYIPIGIILIVQGEDYGLYNSDNVVLIMLNYGYLVFMTFLLNLLSLHLEYCVSLTEKIDLKDIYSHNLGNALQSVYTSINLLDFQNLTQEDKLTVKEALDSKLKEAEKLLREIREL